MPLLSELGVRIDDFVTFPINMGMEGGPRHTAQIVGPPEFPDCAMVYLAPPQPDEKGNIFIYNPQTNIKRGTQERVGLDKRGRYIWKDSPLSQGEMRAQGIHMEYTLFEAA